MAYNPNIFLSNTAYACLISGKYMIIVLEQIFSMAFVSSSYWESQKTSKMLRFIKYFQKYKFDYLLLIHTYKI